MRAYTYAYHVCAWWLRRLEEELQREGCEPTWVLGAEPGSSARVARVLNTPASCLFFFFLSSIFLGDSWRRSQSSKKLCLVFPCAHHWSDSTVPSQPWSSIRGGSQEEWRGQAAGDSGHWAAFPCWSRAFLPHFRRVPLHPATFCSVLCPLLCSFLQFCDFPGGKWKETE